MNGQLRPRFLTGLMLLVAAGLAACESTGLSAPKLPGVSSLFDKEPDPPLPGTRISVLSSGEVTGAAASVEAKEPVILPAAQNNPSWSQPGGTASNSPGHLAFSGGSKPQWSGDAGTGSGSGGRITAIPVVYDGKVFTLDRRGLVTAFSLNGGELWHVSLRPEDEKADAGYGGGLAADGGKLYVATGFGSISALSIATGKPLWTKSLGVPVRASPTAANGKVYVVNSESQLFALSGEDGKELWTSRGLPEGAEILSNVSPAISGNVLVVSYPSGEVSAIDVANGQQKWTDSVSGGSATTITSIGEAARPVIDGDTVFAASQSGRLIATSIKSGDRVWSRDIRTDQTPAVAGDTVFVTDTGGRIYALARKTGKIRWVTTLPEARIWTGPTLAGGKLWLISNKGLLVGVDAQSGKIASQSNLDSPVYIPPVVASGRMFVLTDKARLIAMN